MELAFVQSSMVIQIYTKSKEVATNALAGLMFQPAPLHPTFFFQKETERQIDLIQNTMANFLLGSCTSP